MKAKVLSDDLDNCLIDFDNKLVISDLLNEYGGKLLEISETLSKSILKEEEKGRKFKKSFIVNGFEENNDNYYIIVVDEDKLPAIKETFIDPKIYLYSVEPNGTQNYPWVFQPTKHCAIFLRSIGYNTGHNNTDAEHITPTNAGDIKETVGSSLENANKRDDKTSTNEGNEGETKGVTIKPKLSPKTKNIKKPAPKKGIQNFFSANDGKTKSPIKKEVIAKKALNDFFKKQEQKPKTLQKSEEATTTQNSIPVKNESPPMVIEESSSSDDEEAREALKRDLFADDDETAAVNPKAKRRRIVESDEEDEPPPVVKEEKEDEEIVIEEENPAEIKTFQDDDGFMITVKDKIKKKSPKKKSPPFVKSERKPISKKEVPKSATKTKQGSITSFFNKK